MFLSPWFAIAGLIAAAGPLAIHLLNRRRFRTVQWAAMDLLREALGQTRRLLRLRDLLLLLVRTACVLLFATALARPYVQSSGPMLDSADPVHAVLLIDNSLSMAHRALNRTTLDEAQAAAVEVIEMLPSGSRISVLPLCGSDVVAGQPWATTLANRQDAVDAVEHITAVDRSTSVAMAIELAADACAKVDRPAAKRILLFTDNQSINWPANSLDKEAQRLPVPMQLIRTGSASPSNTWVQDFAIQDEVADVGSQAVFVATIAHDGDAPRLDAEVSLAIDGLPVASQSVRLEPGQTRQVVFPPYRFDMAIEPGEFHTAVAEVSLSPDRLPEDDRRALVVPVVAELPVVFVDQYGPGESPRRNRYGDTYWLRRLLAPKTDVGGRPLVAVRHTTIEQLDRSMLEDARLVVVAGVADPAPAADLLYAYVQQGGSLLIAAGGSFDPNRWNAAAWHVPHKLLPLPLSATPIGRTPDQGAARLEPFQLDPTSMADPLFELGQASTEELADLYRLPFFFKAVVPESDDRTVGALVDETAARLSAERRRRAQLGKQLAALHAEAARSPLSPRQEEELERLRARRNELEPTWLLWSDQLPPAESASLAPEAVAEQRRPRILARYGNGAPFLVRRDVGRGTVVLLTSGIGRRWNTLTTTNAVLLLDRVCRELIGRSLPRRNVGTYQKLTLPVAAAERRDRFVLTNPKDETRDLTADALGANRYGLSLADMAYRGVYHVAAYRPTSEFSADGGIEGSASQQLAPRWEIALAVAGPAEESRLSALSPAELASRLGAGERWIAGDGAIALQANLLQRQDLWPWLLSAAVVCLLVEILLLSWRPFVRGQNR